MSLRYQSLTHEIHDPQGKSITANQYLEDFLNEKTNEKTNGAKGATQCVPH